MARGSRYARSGFTLLELVITVAILAIVTAIAVPGFQSTFRSNRATSGANELLTLMSYARNEAIRSNIGNGTVTAAAVCASANGAECGGTWNDGWLVYRDLDTSGGPDPDELLRYVTPNPQLDIQSANAQFEFDNRGRLRPLVNPGGDTITIEPVTCAPGQPFRRILTFGTTGQVRVTRENCS